MAYTAKVKVNTVLNIRKGPGKDRDKVGSLNNGAKVTVSEEIDGWGKIGEGQWVSLKYVEKV